MQQLEEKKSRIQEDEIDLLDLLKIILDYKKMIIFVTIIFMAIALIGGYVYNRNKVVNSVVISLEYPGVVEGKNPDGSDFSINELMPLKVTNEVFSKYKNEIKQKNNIEFENSIIVKGIIPDVVKTKIRQAAERGENYVFFPTRYEIYSNNNATVLRELVHGAMDNFITEYRPNALIDYVPELREYDYEEVQTILSDKLNLLRKIAENKEKNNFISTKLGYSFNQILRELNVIQNVDLQSLYSYTSINGLTVDKNMREIIYNADIRDLNLKKEALIARAQVVKQMLQDYKPKEKSFVIPNIGELNGKIDLANDYYSKLIEEYLGINNQIKTTEFEIKRVENAKALIKTPTPEEKKAIAEKLDTIIEKTNKVIEKINIITKEYIRVKYANMIKVDSPVITINTGKPYYMFLFGGAIVGFFFSLFLIFVSEVKKEYKKKFSK